MNDVARLVAATTAAVIGAWLVISGLGQRRPSLLRAAAHLARQGRDAPGTIHVAGGWARGGRLVYRGRGFPGGVIADLRLVQRPPEAHAAMLVAAATAGFFGPALLIALGQAAGVLALGVVIPGVIALAVALLAPVFVHLAMRTTAAEVRRDLRHQLSSYLDVVTMLLAGNVGNEGSLRQASQAGDGRLFIELRDRILVAETSNRSLVSALARLGEDLQLLELQQIAASAALGSSAGAPVARSLGAKCATLRSALAAEQEAEARIRTGKITVPLVGMSLLIMAAVIYPALNV